MLLEKLKLKQGQLSDYKFAEKLGISHQLWQMTRSGKREIGQTILEAIVRAYPELDRYVLFFLRGDVVTSSTADNFTTPSEASQDGKLGRFRGWLRGFINRTKELWHNSREP